MRIYKLNSFLNVENSIEKLNLKQRNMYAPNRKRFRIRLAVLYRSIQYSNKLFI